MNLRRFRLVLFAVLVAATAAVAVVFAGGAAGADNNKSVRWDIIRLTTPGGVTTVNAGGFADAQTQAPAATFGPIQTIRLTGSGTFDAPSGKNDDSDDVTGGGTWSIIGGASGTYKVTELVSWEFASFQTPGFEDTIGDKNERANGSAVLRIYYSDGDSGVLTIGCHGPGAPNHIFEGIAVTKSFKTYYTVQNPGADPNANRTIFHVSAGGDADD
jgi:hypothetical protein